MRLRALCLIAPVAVIAVSVGTAYGVGHLFVYAFSPPMVDGHATSTSLTDASYFLLGVIVGGFAGLAPSVTGIWFVVRHLNRHFAKPSY